MQSCAVKCSLVHQQQQLTGNKLTHSIAVQSILEYSSAVYSQEQFSSSSKLTQYCSLEHFRVFLSILVQSSASAAANRQQADTQEPPSLFVRPFFIIGIIFIIVVVIVLIVAIIIVCLDCYMFHNSIMFNVALFDMYDSRCYMLNVKLL